MDEQVRTGTPYGIRLVRTAMRGGHPAADALGIILPYVNRWKAGLVVLALTLPGCTVPPLPATESPIVAASYFPLGEGAQWTYRVSGSLRPRHTVKVQPPVQITPRRFSETGPHEMRAWVLDGFLDELAFACPSGNGADIFVQRKIGATARWAHVGFARYRWSQEEEWGFETQSGCIVNPVWTRRRGPERVSTPAGTFECMKLTNPHGVYPTVWLAAGVGVVRREGRLVPGDESSPWEVWELTSYSGPMPPAR